LRLFNGRDAASRAPRPPAREELGVARINVDHALALRVEKILEDEDALVGRERIGWPEPNLEVAVARAPGRKRFELDEKRRQPD